SGSIARCSSLGRRGGERLWPRPSASPHRRRRRSVNEAEVVAGRGSSVSKASCWRFAVDASVWFVPSSTLGSDEEERSRAAGSGQSPHSKTAPLDLDR